MRFCYTLVLLLLLSASCTVYAQQDQSLGDAARRARAEKAEESAQMGEPDWMKHGPQPNHEPISEAQLVGWVLGGVPAEDLLTELHDRGIAFLPSQEFGELLRRAGADGTVIDEVTRTERRSGNGSPSEEMAALAKVVADTQAQDDRHAFREAFMLLKTDSMNPGLYVLVGHMFEKQENWEGMIDAYYRAIQLDRDFAYSHGRLSLACYKTEQGCAKTEAEAMLALQPKSADGHKLLGLAYMLMHNAPAALTEYQRALSLGSKEPDLVYYDIGLTKEMVHDNEGAIAAYRRAIEINPNNWRGFNALGEAYVQRGNIDEGVLNLREAKALAPDCLDIRQNLGAALCNSGRHADAIVEFEELLQMDPDWNMARHCLAKSLKAVGRLEEAQKVRDEYNRREGQQ